MAPFQFSVLRGRGGRALTARTSGPRRAQPGRGTPPTPFCPARLPVHTPHLSLPIGRGPRPGGGSEPASGRGRAASAQDGGVGGVGGAALALAERAPGRRAGTVHAASAAASSPRPRAGESAPGTPPRPGASPPPVRLGPSGTPRPGALTVPEPAFPAPPSLPGAPRLPPARPPARPGLGRGGPPGASSGARVPASWLPGGHPRLMPARERPARDAGVPGRPGEGGTGGVRLGGGEPGRLAGDSRPELQAREIASPRPDLLGFPPLPLRPGMSGCLNRSSRPLGALRLPGFALPASPDSPCPARPGSRPCCSPVAFRIPGSPACQPSNPCDPPDTVL